MEFSETRVRQTYSLINFGGGKGIRTPDLLTASQALYQLSYAPGADAHVIRRRVFHDFDSTRVDPTGPGRGSRGRPTRAERCMPGCSIAD